MACLVMIPKNTSTRYSHDPDVGVKCNTILGLRSSKAFTLGCVGRVVVAHDMDLTARIRLGDQH